MEAMTNQRVIARTVRQLRLALGDTQQQFAERMGWAISTAVRYETTRAPRGRALADLARMAIARGWDDIASVFRMTLAEELGIKSYDVDFLWRKER